MGTDCMVFITDYIEYITFIIGIVIVLIGGIAALVHDRYGSIYCTSDQVDNLLLLGFCIAIGSWAVILGE